MSSWFAIARKLSKTQILGRRSVSVPSRAEPQVQSFNSLRAEELDPFSNAMVEIEEFIFPSQSPYGQGQRTPPLEMPFFCIPTNDKLLNYWDTVADRLFKIRHCMNITGVVRELPLFEAPISPELLVQAVAAGVDLTSILSDVNPALPPYRFNVLFQKAVELANDVKALGGVFLSALEKRDAEAVALLRSHHEIQVLTEVRNIRSRQIEEAKESLQGLKENYVVVEHRQQHYQRLLNQIQAPDQPSNPAQEVRQNLNLSDNERTQLSLMQQGMDLQIVQAGIDYVANTLRKAPDAKVGAPPTIGTSLGGSQFGGALRAFSAYMGALSGILNTTGSMSGLVAGHQRREEDWNFQEAMARKELEHVRRQILAAEIRLAIAELELKNHDGQIENTKEVEDFLRDKYTNQELYDWMVGQVAGVYFQAYQLAYDVAKKAERAYRFEVGLQDSNFIQFGYWDSLKKGLLAGERLYQDIKRLEVSYLDQNQREYEITKHISLAQLDPMALVKFKVVGSCEVELPEALFDLDYRGHYMRRVRTVAVSIPCVTGPYTSVNSKLTLLHSSIRVNTRLDSSYSRTVDGSGLPTHDTRFLDSFGAPQSVVTSNGQNDSGLFEPSLRDERYLPFEGRGVISRWRIELPSDFRAFDYDTISDVVIHLRYTAREGGKRLADAATHEIRNRLNELMKTADRAGGFARLFSLRHEFAGWNKFISADGDRTLELDLHDRFPLLFHGRKITVKQIELFARGRENFGATKNENVKKRKNEIQQGKLNLNNVDLPELGDWGGQVDILQSEKGNLDWELDQEVVWKLTTKGITKPAMAGIEDMWLICYYEVGSTNNTPVG